jgi:hypothetical protein
VSVHGKILEEQNPDSPPPTWKTLNKEDPHQNPEEKYAKKLEELGIEPEPPVVGRPQFIPRSVLFGPTEPRVGNIVRPIRLDNVV